MQVEAAVLRLPSCRGGAVSPLPATETISQRRVGASTFVPRGRVLFWQGDNQDQAVELVHGVVRAVRLLENGSRQILAFYWPGAVIRPSHAACQYYTAEAITSCRLYRWRFAPVHSISEPCGADQVLQEMLPLLLIMGQKTTISRLAWFLLRIREHLPRDPRRPDALQIVLPRADMADYLGMSIETVSRTLAEFKAKGLIDLPTRKTIRFVDIPTLSKIAEA
jgi:CRP/FNR family transcriptional regulator, anaerobic regulatory protein